MQEVNLVLLGLLFSGGVDAHADRFEHPTTQFGNGLRHDMSRHSCICVQSWKCVCPSHRDEQCFLLMLVPVLGQALLQELLPAQYM